MIRMDQLSDEELYRLIDALPEVPDELVTKIVNDFLEIAQYGFSCSDLLVERAFRRAISGSSD